MNKYENLSHSERLKLCSSFVYGVNQPSRFIPQNGKEIYKRLIVREIQSSDLVTETTTRLAQPLYQAVRETVNHLERIRRMDLKPEMHLCAIGSILNLEKGTVLENLGLNRRPSQKTEELEQQLDFYFNYAINKTNDVLRSAGY